MNIALIGMPGAGKSAVGKELARRLGYEFIDIDRLLEKRLGLKLQQIVDDVGEEEFINMEAREVLGLRKVENSVVSPGGSIVYSGDAMELLQEISTVVFLDAAFEVIERRIKNLKTRGIIRLRDRSLRDLFNERRVLYQSYAEITAPVQEGAGVEQVATEIVARVFPLPDR